MIMYLNLMFFLFFYLVPITASAPPLEKPIGLQNCGVSCYVNSGIQLILSVNPLAHLASKNQLRGAKELTDCAITLLENITQKAPADFLNRSIENLALQAALDIGYGQQDSQEFLIQLLDDFIAENALQAQLTVQETAEITCSNKRISRKITLFPLLPLTIDHSTTLNEMLTNYTQPSSIELRDEAGWPMNDCFKRNSIKLPEWFFVGTNRFAFDAKTMTPFKITKPLEIPIALTIHTMTYDLHAFICHGGQVTGGHYWAYARYGNNWYRCNDTAITPIDVTDAQFIQEKNSNGYVFLYHLPDAADQLKKQDTYLAQIAQPPVAPPTPATPPTPQPSTVPRLEEHKLLSYLQDLYNNLIVLEEALTA